MYDFLLIIHSWLRWAVLILALLVVVKSFIGWFGNGEYSKGDNGMAAGMVGTLHLQFLIGLILYVFLSPLTQAAFTDFGAAVKDSALRYWAVEHIFVMIVAIGIASIGRSKSKKAAESVQKFKLQAIFYTIALVLILSRIPWDQAERMFRM